MIKLAVKCSRAYTHLTHEDNDFGMGSTDIEPDHTEDDISTYQAYLTNLLSPSSSQTSKFFSLSPFEMNFLTMSKSSSLSTTRMRNVTNSSPCLPATSSTASHTPPIGTKPVINSQVNVHEVEEQSV